ncbi:helix-turn-helix domain-containing protein [Flexivirga sp.]|uniref:helix-turn-helix domain-containing protein n=1 Tax=Flexivirga sp. TaxID=1962927 RepID=UPI003F7F2D76
MTSTNESIYMTVAEVAELYKCSPKSIRRRVADGSLPAITLGERTMRIARADAVALAVPVSTGRNA